ncbi:unnamed protein product, partial [Didymodactylos carnosus]
SLLTLIKPGFGIPLASGCDDIMNKSTYVYKYEDLPSPVDDADDMVIGQLDSSFDVHNDELSELIAPIVPSSSSSNEIRNRTFSDVDQPPSSNLSFSRHNPIRHAATDNYLRMVTKKLLNLFSVQDHVDLKSSCPQELRQTDVSALDNGTFIEACKLYACGST